MKRYFRVWLAICCFLMALPAAADEKRHTAMALLDDEEEVALIVEFRSDVVPGSIASVPAAQGSVARYRTMERIASHARSERSLRHFQHLSVMAMTVDQDGLEALLDDPDVVAIQREERARLLLTDSVPYINGPALWAQGGRGEGWSIAVLDSGVSAEHPFLTGRVVAEACFSSNRPADKASSLCPHQEESSLITGAGGPCPSGVFGCDHGTHVAGIAAGYLDEGFAGVAPQAGVIAIQVFSRIDDPMFCGGSEETPCLASYTSDQLAALDYVLSLSEGEGTHQIAAVNMSLGGEVYYSSHSECNLANRVTMNAVMRLRDVGVATVVAAGNEAVTGSLSAPACLSDTIAVGAVNASGTQVATYSNHDEMIDLLAPGDAIYSSIPGDEYHKASGTSMAVPHVAGGFAALRSLIPGASVNLLLRAMKDGGVEVEAPGRGPAKPRLDLYGAFQELSENLAAIQVTLEPDKAREAGARWRLLGEVNWRKSGDSADFLAANSEYTIEFYMLDEDRWVTPEHQVVTTGDGRLELTAHYQAVSKGGGAAGWYLLILLLFVLWYQRSIRIGFLLPG